MTAFPGDVQKAPVSIILGFKKPGRVIEWIGSRGE